MLALWRYNGRMLATLEAGGLPKAIKHMRIAQADSARLPLADEWRNLSDNAVEPNPFFDHWFLPAALEHLGKADCIRIAEYRVGDELCGIFPLAFASNYGRMPIRHLRNWTHYQCFMGTPLVRKGHEVDFWRELLLELDEAPWIKTFASFTALDNGGPMHMALVAAARSVNRPAPTVHRQLRAMLRSGVSFDDYLTQHIRPKKRKEWRRLGHRLAEMGTLAFDRLGPGHDIADWCETFLALEASGWKGRTGAALKNMPETEAFFRAAMAAAHANGSLDFQRLTLNDRPIAMLINFLTPPGSWSFKIAFDEALARFSPGVMIELRNLERVLADPELDWMDSCAVENHPMIDSLWAERREIVQVSVPLKGIARQAAYRLCRSAEIVSAAVRKQLGEGAKA